MIVLVAGEREAEPLDRPRDEERRNIVLRRVERLDQRLHAMAAKIGEQRGERGIVMLFEEACSFLAQLGLDASAPRRAALIVERRKLGIGQRLRTSP